MQSVYDLRRENLRRLIGLYDDPNEDLRRTVRRTVMLTSILGVLTVIELTLLILD